MDWRKKIWIRQRMSARRSKSPASRSPVPLSYSSYPSTRSTRHVDDEQKQDQQTYFAILNNVYGQFQQQYLTNDEEVEHAQRQIVKALKRNVSATIGTDALFAIDQAVALSFAYYSSPFEDSLHRATVKGLQQCADRIERNNIDPLEDSAFKWLGSKMAGPFRAFYRMIRRGSVSIRSDVAEFGIPSVSSGYLMYRFVMQFYGTLQAMRYLAMDTPENAKQAGALLRLAETGFNIKKHFLNVFDEVWGKSSSVLSSSSAVAIPSSATAMVVDDVLMEACLSNLSLPSEQIAKHTCPTLTALMKTLGPLMLEQDAVRVTIAEQLPETDQGWWLADLTSALASKTGDLIEFAKKGTRVLLHDEYRAVEKFRSGHSEMNTEIERLVASVEVVNNGFIYLCLFLFLVLIVRIVYLKMRETPRMSASRVGSIVRSLQPPSAAILSSALSAKRSQSPSPRRFGKKSPARRKMSRNVISKRRDVSGKVSRKRSGKVVRKESRKISAKVTRKMSGKVTRTQKNKK